MCLVMECWVLEGVATREPGMGVRMRNQFEYRKEEILLGATWLSIHPDLTWIYRFHSQFCTLILT